MADSESAALTGLGDTPALGAVGETRTLMALTTATSRLRVYQFRHPRTRAWILHEKFIIDFKIDTYYENKIVGLLEKVLCLREKEVTLLESHLISFLLFVS